MSTPEKPVVEPLSAEDAIARAEKAVDDLCNGRLRWEMRVPAEPDHDPDLIISEALRVARRLLDAARTASVAGLDRAEEATTVMILRSLNARYLDDEGDGYGGIPFVSLDEAIRALTTDRERYAAAALNSAPSIEQEPGACVSCDEDHDTDLHDHHWHDLDETTYIGEAHARLREQEPGDWTDLANDIRRADGNHDLGAGELAGRLWDRGWRREPDPAGDLTADEADHGHPSITHTHSGRRHRHVALREQEPGETLRTAVIIHTVVCQTDHEFGTTDNPCEKAAHQVTRSVRAVLEADPQETER